MDLGCAAPDLRQLDVRDSELLLCAVFSDERPVHGLAGLIGWRLAGMIDRLLETGFFSGDAGETLLVPGKPRLSAEKVVFVGLGPRATFDDARCEWAVDLMIGCAVGLDVRSIILEVPGRHVEAIDAESGVEAVLAAVARHEARLDRVTLVERSSAHKLVLDRVARQRRLAGRT